jgi:hypothetical protein
MNAHRAGIVPRMLTGDHVSQMNPSYWIIYSPQYSGWDRYFHRPVCWHPHRTARLCCLYDWTTAGGID